MNEVNETLNQIQTLLTKAEDVLINDDGRRWPPPPVSPKNRRDWAKDDSAAVDPNDDESCKAYLLNTVLTQPVLMPGNRLGDRTDVMAAKLRASPQQTWIPMRGGYARRSRWTAIKVVAEIKVTRKKSI
jgi:hypothetical protein